MNSKRMYKDMTIHHYKYRRKPNRSLGGDIGVSSHDEEENEAPKEKISQNVKKAIESIKSS